ncbi:MAG: cation:proton antiporter subunit C [Nitrospira sp.]|nr:cation:proton antiporter subunit C [Nitrospira sp.]
MFDLIEAWLLRPNFLAFVILFLWGLYIMVARHNLVKKLIGLYIVQTSVLLFFIALSAKTGATVPVLVSAADAVQAATYTNPLPHVLTLTAIVVQVATLGVSLALVAVIYRTYGTLDEEEILKKLE